MEFKVDKCWDNGFPFIKKSVFVDYFSLCKDRKLSKDLSQLKYLQPELKCGKVLFNLNEHNDKIVETQFNANNINHILEWILKNYNSVKNPEESPIWLSQDFICRCDLLTKIWTTPFENEDGWTLCAAKFRGNIYLCGFDTDKDKLHMIERDKKCSTWGNSFKHFLLTDDPENSIDPNKTIHPNEEFNCIFTTRFGSHKLLYGAKMDGIKANNKITDNENLNKFPFIEIKTTSEIKTFKQEQIFLNKLLKWWCQGFLVGVNEIICGFSNEAGIVKEIIPYDLIELMQISKEMWTPEPALNFGDAFLDFIKSVVHKDYNECIYKFTWIPRTNVSVEEMKSNSDYAFLPPWFTMIAENL